MRKPTLSTSSQLILDYLEAIGGDYVGGVDGIKSVVVIDRRSVVTGLQDLVAAGKVRVTNKPKALGESRLVPVDIARVELVSPQREV